MEALKSCIGDERGAVRAFASRLGVPPPLLSQWMSSDKPRKVPRERCPSIERATDGRVTVEQMRPDVAWVRVPDAAWPHPAGRPCIDVAAPAAQEVSHAAA